MDRAGCQEHGAAGGICVYGERYSPFRRQVQGCLLHISAMRQKQFSDLRVAPVSGPLLVRSPPRTGGDKK